MLRVTTVKQALRASSQLAATRNPEASSYVQQIESEWETAKPFKEIPGLTRWQLFRGFQKGGQYHKLESDILRNPLTAPNLLLRSQGILKKTPLWFTCSTIAAYRIAS